MKPLSTAALPRLLREPLERAYADLTTPADMRPVDFSEPKGEPALAAPDSVSWQVFRNPVSLFVGGVAAVLLELAEPRVRTGVWEHTSFRTDPLPRLKRTGLAAMVTVYGARGVAERMIAGVGRMHGRVAGETPAGKAYRADDPALLDWVQATASFGFLEAWCALVRPLPDAEKDRFYAEGEPAARLYGAAGAPRSLAQQRTLFEAMRPGLEPSPIVGEFLDIMGRAPIAPGPLRPMQGLLIDAAVTILPDWTIALLGLEQRRLRPWQVRLVQRAARLADRVLLPASPPVQACRRLGLPDDYLFRARSPAG